MPKARGRGGVGGGAAALRLGIGGGSDMFDGNHRVRREVNLGGARRRGGRNRASGGRRVGASAPAAVSATAASTSAARGVPDRKAELLESARAQREARREEKRRNDAAREVQRRYRGFRGRRDVALRLGERRRVLASGATGKAVDLREWVSVLSASVGPHLRPFLGHDNGDCRSKVAETETEALLAFRAALGSLSPAEDPWGAVSAGSDEEEDAEQRSHFVKGRLVRRALVLLRDLCPPSSKEEGDAADKARGLEWLVSRLVGAPDLSSLDGNAHYVSVSDSSPILLSVLRNGPQTSRLEGSGLVALFLCFRDWFWAASVPIRSSPGRGTETARALLHLSCRAASALGGDGGGKDGSEGEDALAILASAIYCSRPAVFRSTLSSSSADKFGGGDEGLWAAEFGRCKGYFSLARVGTKVDEDRAAGWHAAMLSSLARTLLGPSLPPAGSIGAVVGAEIENGDRAVRDAVAGMVSGREVSLLSNAMAFLEFEASSSSDSSAGNGGNGSGSIDLAAASSVARLLDHVLGRWRRAELGALAAAAAAGEDVWDSVLGGDDAAAAAGSKAIGLAEGDDGGSGSTDSDSEMEEDDEAPRRPPSAAARDVFSYKRSGSSRMSRSEVQTVSKLDRKYRAEVAKARGDATEAVKRSVGNSGSEGEKREEVRMVAGLCADLGGGETMARLGTALLVSRSKDTSASGGEGGGAMEMEEARAAYVSVLSDLLQFCTSSSARSPAAASSPLLSAIAFRPALLGALWSRTSADGGVTAAASPAAMAAFCDAFAHRLMAVDDEEFLACYTAAKGGPEGRSGSTIEAGGVVSTLRAALYELYWTRPVVADDVVPPCSVVTVSSAAAVGSLGGDDRLLRSHRARLLLSGTKLWNALYERWCRLYRTSPFCEEEIWWFPRLVTQERDDGGAVLPGTSAGGGAGEEEDMEDGDSAASPMDVDGGEGNDDDDEGESGGDARSAADEESDALASAFRDPKMARVLTSIPQSLPFERRVRLFNALLDADKAKTQDEERSFRALMMQMQRRDMDSDEEWEFTGRERVEIRRDRLYKDSMEQLNRLGRKLRRKVQVTFINQHGAQEAGIDGGGVFKEFLDDLIKDAFDPELGRQSDVGGFSSSSRGHTMAPLFVESPVQTLQVNPAAGIGRPTLAHYEFLGRVLGKAVYESILVEPQFCLPFLNQLLGKQNTIDDLKNIDPEYYRHLNALRKMSERDIEGLGLTFEYTTSDTKDAGKAPQTIELVPGGSSSPVTKSNVIRYVHLVAHRKLNAETAVQTHVFLRGFRDLIPAAWVRLFSSYELQKLISGDDSVRGVDVNGLRAIMQYSGGYHPSQPIIQWFWQVLEEMTAQQQRNFLKFMTSCSRQPLLGFRALVPPPCIQQIRLRDENGRGVFGGGARGGNARLPTSSTCMNLLKLPNYESKEMLREKLLYAVEAGAGFELS